MIAPASTSPWCRWGGARLQSRAGEGLPIAASRSASVPCEAVCSRIAERLLRSFPVSALQRRPDFGGEIGRRFLDSLAEREADKAGHPDRRASLFGRCFDDLGDASFIVDHKDLIEQYRLFVVFAQPSLDHSGNDLFRLAAAGGLLAQDGAFPV